jgi:hypothetical protein
MAAEKLQIVVDATVKGKRDVEGLNKELGGLDKSGGKAGLSLGGLAKTAGMVAGGLYIAKEAAQVAWKVIGEGAELIAARDRFDNLAASINTTGEAMMGTLRQATKGMVSDAELVASATDIISLGLAGTEDDVARLATVISTLGLDMNQVIMTFANNSVMRLDALGLSVEGVKTKAAELEAQGFQGDAFDEAVLISLEEKMVLLGDASATTAGHMAILKAEATDAKNAVKEFLAELAAPTIKAAAESTETYRLQLKATAREIAEAAESPAEMRREMEKMFGPDIFKNAEEMGLAWVDLGNGASFWIDELERAATKTDDYSRSLDELRRMSQEYSTVAGTSATATQDYVYSLEELAQMGRAAMPEAMENMAEAEAAAAAETLRLKEAHDAAKLAAEEHAAMTGDLFVSQLERGTEETFNLMESLFEQTDAAGASAETLGLLAIATGQYTEEQVKAALQAAVLEEQIGILAEQVASGKITIEEATAQIGLMQEGLGGVASSAYTAHIRLRELDTDLKELDGRSAQINVSAPGLESLVAQMEALKSGLGSGGGAKESSSGKGGASSTNSGAKAIGGPVSAGNTYLVGELGPEMFVPAQSGQIIPNNQMGNNTTFNVAFYGGQDRLGQQSSLNSLKAMFGGI